MLTEIGLTNFKLHKKTALGLKPITIFIGPNNSGKSSIFQAIQLMKQAKKRSSNQFVNPIPVDRNYSHSANSPSYQLPDNLIDVGDFKDVVSGGNDHIIFDIKGAARWQQNTPSFHIRYFFRNNYLVHHSGEFLGSELLDNISWTWDKEKSQRGKQQSIEKIIRTDIGKLRCTISPNETLNHVLDSSVWGEDNETNRESIEIYSKRVRLEMELVNDYLLRVHLIYGLRGFEEKYHPLANYPPEEIEWLLLSDRAMAMVSIFPYDRTLENKLSDWLSKFFGAQVEFEMKPGRTVNIKIRKGKNSITAVNEGLGIHQAIFILTPIALGRMGDTFLIEEPEAHLHPKAQSELTKSLIRVFKDEYKQFIMSTHSEHILFPILNAIAKKELSMDDVAIYYFQNINDEANIRALEIDENGRVKGGLPGFFEQDVTEIIDALGNE